jgi:octaprenyl-diphosphate synthase
LHVTTHPDTAAGSLVGPLTLDALQGPVVDGLDRVLDEIRRIVVSDFGMIEEVNEYLLMVRGKLFRPTLTLLSNHVGERPDPRAVTLAAVVELVHLATLVHDDAVDHSVLRRGQPTVNALWTHQVAIIMGDYLYSRAVIELARIGIMDAVRIMGAAANEMSVGEMRQLTSYDALDFSERDYDRLIASKTASLMAAACEMGALVGEPRFREPLRRFGHNLGMAFQIADDLLDYTGTEAETGKPTGHDLRERKVTLPLVATLRDASPAEMEAIRRLFSGEREPGDDEIARVMEIVRERGGLDYARRRAMEFAEAAEEALSEVAAGEARQSLMSCVVYATQRSR